MASIKKKSSGGGGANWMDTYGDMVTLLLCFFVLLYSMSTIDQTKWMLVIQSFNRNAIVNPDDAPPGPEGSQTSSGGDGLPSTTEIEQALDELYEFLQTYAASQDAGTVSVSQGDGYVFISFDDTVFFAGDSFELRADGRAILDDIIPALSECGPYIDELEVLGHTAQARPNVPNPPDGDWRLSTNRADSVVVYLMQNIDANLLEPGRYVAKGFGQYRPIADNDVEENRAKNRRVELVITGRNLNELDNNYEKYFEMYNTTQDVPEYTTND